MNNCAKKVTYFTTPDEPLKPYAHSETQIPFITWPELEIVLRGLVDRGVLTEEQRCAVFDEADERVEFLKTNRQEQDRAQAEARRLRKSCKATAARFSFDTVAAITEQKKALRQKLTEKKHEILTKYKVDSMLLTAEENEAVAEIKKIRADANFEMLTIPEDQPRRAELLATMADLDLKSAQTIAKLRIRRRSLIESRDEKIKAAKLETDKFIADCDRRIEAARDALSVTISIIESADDDELPALYQSILGREGGDK